MSSNSTLTPHDYTSPPLTLILTFLLLLFFFIGFCSVFFCRCFIHAAPFTSFRRRTHAADPPGPESKGLDPEILKSLPTFEYSSVKDLRIDTYGLECAICIGEFIKEEVIRLLPKCCHVFHQECIDLWLEEHKTCPICRRDLEKFEPQQQLQQQQPQSMSGTIHEDEPLEVRVDVIEVYDKFSKCRSTGHSIMKRDQDLGVDRFTLRLPDHLHAKLLRGHNWTGSCTVFGEFKSKTDAGYGGFGEISDFAGGEGGATDSIIRKN